MAFFFFFLATVRHAQDLIPDLENYFCPLPELGLPLVPSILADVGGGDPWLLARLVLLVDPFSHVFRKCFTLEFESCGDSKHISHSCSSSVIKGDVPHSLHRPQPSSSAACDVGGLR